MSIAGNLTQLKAQLPEGVTLVAVSKFHPAEAIREAYTAGQRIFGESRAQEIKAKQPQLPDDIQWHFIGTLQSNKVKDIAPFIHTIHSVDSLKLLQEIDRQAGKHNRTIHVLLEIHIAQEVSKHGLSMEECLELLQDESIRKMEHVLISGLMGMATFTDDHELVRAEFRRLASFFNELKDGPFRENTDFRILSMGMSDDFPVAITEGSTMIRVGTGIFGEREY